MKFPATTLILLLILPCLMARADRPAKAFKALSIYDYFTARQLFIKEFSKKHDPYSAYGLALIYSRNDNPFHQLDSAARYVNISYNRFNEKKLARTYQDFSIDSASILRLADTISGKRFRQIKKENTIHSYEKFLRNNYLGRRRLLWEAASLRDELEFARVSSLYRSDSTMAFIQTHPFSLLLSEAQILLERQIYDELTRDGRPESYKKFIAAHPQNLMVNTAYERLFHYFGAKKDVSGMAAFVQEYPNAPQNMEAWKLLFSWSVKTYSYTELRKFLEDYPAFPLKHTILKELEMNKIQLFPYRGSNELMGFVDDKGRTLIQPRYLEATVFSEGLAVVAKGDSVFFINKENENPFSKIYVAALQFKNGLAPVKQDKWVFMNRQGQIVSKSYDEVNELSDNVYVIRNGDKYGALDHFAQTVIEPRFDALGDFKNGFAYYREKDKYGFVSRQGAVFRAQFDWISDFSAYQVAVIKQNGKYGLVSSSGKILLEPLYDFVHRTESKVFVVVSGNAYGFYSSDGCFLSQVIYDYQKDRQPDQYTDGTLLKLLKKKEQTLADANGRLLLPYGSYEEIGLPSEGLFCVKRKGKWGYLDSKMNLHIPLRYSGAGDFSEGIALAELKDKYLLIDSQGNTVFESGSRIERVDSDYFRVHDEAGTIVNRRGEFVLKGVVDIQSPQPGLLVVLLDGGELRLLNR